MTNRRIFLKNSSYFAAGSLLLPLGCANKQQKAEDVASDAVDENTEEIKTKQIGVQVYSVRDALQEDFAGSMTKLADIGFKHIEAFGLGLDGKIYGMAPAEYKKIVTDLGMEIISSHATYFTPDQASAVKEAAEEAGLKFVIVPWLGEEYRKDYSAVADNLNKIGETFKDSGIRLGYHNHSFEFEKQGDEYPLDILISQTDPSLVTFQLDLFWVVNGGAEPMELINRYPGRFSSFHVKDSDDALEQTTVGTGIIDFETILSNANSGMEYYFVEDERTDDPFANLKAAHDYLNEATFV